MMIRVIPRAKAMSTTFGRLERASQHAGALLPSRASQRSLTISTQFRGASAASLKVDDDSPYEHIRHVDNSTDENYVDSSVYTEARGRDPYWQTIPLWKDVSEAEFLSYRWQVRSCLYFIWPLWANLS